MIDWTSSLSTMSAGEEGESTFENVRGQLSNVEKVLSSENPRSLTEAALNDMAKQLGKIIQAVRRMPSEIVYMHIRSRDAMLTHLRKGIIELHLAVDQLEMKGRTARFYKCFCSFQEYFEKACEQMLPETHGGQDAVGNVFLSSSRQRDWAGHANGNFIAQLWKHRQELISAQMPLQQVSLLFCEANIWPDQCEHALILLRVLSTLLKDQCSLFNVPLSMQYGKTLSLASQELLIALRYADENTRILISLIATFRSLCHSKANRAISLRQEISGKLDLLVRSSDDITQKMQRLIFSHDEASFQHNSHTLARHHFEM